MCYKIFSICFTIYYKYFENLPTVLIIIFGFPAKTGQFWGENRLVKWSMETPNVLEVAIPPFTSPWERMAQTKQSWSLPALLTTSATEAFVWLV